MKKSWTLIPLGLAVLAVLGTLGLERLFTGSNREWDTAIQATLGVVLTVTTAIYATLTFLLLRTSQDAPREAAERAAIVDVRIAIVGESHRLLRVISRYPIDISGSVPDESIFL